MNDQRMRFTLGVFVLGAMLLLAVLIVLFGGFPNVLRPRDSYTFVFDNAPGVSPGTPVRRSGVRIGEVRTVALEDATGRVLVTVLIDKAHPIYETDVPTVVHGLLSGDTSIDLVPRRLEERGGGGEEEAEQGPPPPGAPKPPPRVVPPGSVIQGGTRSGVTDLLNQANRAVPTAEQSLNQIRKTMESYERLQPVMEETLKAYRDLAKGTNAALPKLQETNESIRQLAEEARQVVPQIRATNQEIQVGVKNWSRLGERLDVLVQTEQDKVLQTIDNANTVLKQTVKTLENINDTVARVATTFDPENQKNLRQILNNVNKGTENLGKIGERTEALLNQGQKTVQKVNETVDEAGKILKNLDEATRPLAARSERIVANLDEATARLNRVLAEVGELIRGLGQGDGTLRRFLNDPSLYNNLNDAACLLARLVPRVDRILRDAEVFADKIARHPEVIGVGGVVNPSSGLKESPAREYPWNPVIRR